VRLHFFVILGVVFALTQGLSLIWNWTAVGLLAWCLFRARYEVRFAVRMAARVDG
jgi:hypothetical protein